MAMNGNARGDADFNAIAAANPNMGLLSPGETNQMKTYFEILFSADTTYIKGNMDTLPTGLSGPGLQNPIGQTVNIPITAAPGNPSEGATDEAISIIGMGSVQ